MKKLLLTLSLATLPFAANAQSWQAITTNAPSLHFVNNIRMVDANTIWFSDQAATSATDQGAYIGRSVDGGATWTNIAPAIAGAGIGDISAISASTAYIVTFPPAASDPAALNGVWKTTDGGATWVEQRTAAYSNANSFANIVHFWDANVGITAGDPINGKFEIYNTTNGGTTWTLNAGAPAPAAGEYGYTGKRAVSGNTIWYGTNQGRLLRSNDKGVTWGIYSTPAVDFGTAANNGDFSFKDSQNGLLLISETVNSVETVTLWTTSDGGQSWIDLTPSGNFYGGDIEYVPGTANMYVTSGSEGASYSKDGGQTWTDIVNPSANPTYKGNTTFLSSSVGFAGGISGAQETSTQLPYGGIYKLVGDLALAVNDTAVKKNSLVAYPNPATDIVNLKAGKEIKAVTIIDASGKVAKRQETSSTVDVSKLSKGVYILQAAYKDGSFENTKVIKK